LGFDIALLKLVTPVIYNSIVSPVCLPPENFATASEDLAIATGWGRLGEVTQKTWTSATMIQSQ